MISNIESRLNVLRELSTSPHAAANLQKVVVILYEVLKHLEVNGIVKSKMTAGGARETLYGDKEVTNGN